MPKPQVHQLDFKVKAFALGNIKGKGNKDLILTDGTSVMVCSLEGDSFGPPEVVFSGSSTENIVDVGVADIDGDGQDEAFITNHPQKSISSFAFQWKDGGYHMAWDKVGLFLRVVRKADAALLLAQPQGYTRPLGDRPYLFHYNGKGYTRVKDEGLSLPSGLSFYGFQVGDVNFDGKEEIVEVDREGRLKVYDDKGQVLWESTYVYGGSVIRLYAKKGTYFEEKGAPLAILDTDGDGMQEIWVVRNIASFGKAGDQFVIKGLVRYSSSYLYQFEWDGVTFQQVSKSKELGGYTSGLMVEDLEGDGKKELVASVINKAQGNTNLLVYRFP